MRPMSQCVPNDIPFENSQADGARHPQGQEVRLQCVWQSVCVIIRSSVSHFLEPQILFPFLRQNFQLNAHLKEHAKQDNLLATAESQGAQIKYKVFMDSDPMVKFEEEVDKDVSE
jgi:hypothetical protein